MSADPVILKILGGVQAGVEVALADGTYLLGTGPDDDIQLVDVSLLPGHARIRVGAGKVEIAAEAGAVQLASGGTLTADQGWRALEPLEVASLGTTRLALAPRSANWASVGEDGPRVGQPVPAAAAAPAPPPAKRARALALPAAALVLVTFVAGWYLVMGGRLPSSSSDHRHDLQAVRTALDAFPFGAAVQARQDVDGAIYVTGYVDAPVQRRALAGALERTDVDLHLRLFVLEDMRREIGALISAEKLSATFALSDKGEVTLDGLILRPARERKLAAEIGDTVTGVSGVISHVRTADTLLEAVRGLVAASQLKPWLLLRLDGDVIEVSGALPTDKVDAWVGFLQTYATRFADEIPLRSFVQLQSPNGKLTPAPAPGEAGALALGAGQAGAGDTAVDVERLQRGDFKLGDIFVSSAAAAHDRESAGAALRRPIAGASAAAVPGPAVLGAAAPRRGDPAPAGVTVAPRSDREARPGAAPTSAATQPTAMIPAAPPAQRKGDTGVPATAVSLVTSGTPGGGPSAQSVIGTSKGTGALDGSAPARRDARSHSEPAPPRDGAASEIGVSARAPVDQGQPAPVAPDVPASTRGGGAAHPADADPEARSGRLTSDAVLRTVPDQLTADAPAGEGIAAGALARQAIEALKRFRDGKSNGGDADRAIDQALALLGSAGNGVSSVAAGPKIADWYLPLFVDPTAPHLGVAQCWDSTALTADDVLPVLFWLDVLSASRLVSLASFDQMQQALLIEAALDPRGIETCGRRTAAGAKAADHSLYLREISRNPGFAAFVLRDLPAVDLDVAGASLGRRRFVITRAGVRMAEGAAPDRGSRLAVVGELGLALQHQDGLSVQLFGPDISWVVAN